MLSIAEIGRRGQILKKINSSVPRMPDMEKIYI